MASRILVRAASEMMGQRVCRMRQAVESLEAQREQERASTERRGAFSQAKDLTRLRSKLNTAVAAQEEGFSFDSYQQRAALLYDWYQLPPVKDPKSKGPSTNDRAIESLYGRMTRKDEYGLPAPTLRSKVAPQDEVVRVLQAMRAGKKWATWERNFLTKGEGEGLTWLKTQYSLHRSATGRLASGSDPTELEKRVSRQQLQNVPKKIRDMVVAPPGQTLVGGDWAGVEWAIAIWYCWMQTRDTYYDDMLKRFFRGEFDPHRYLASFAFGVPEAQITGQQRRVTKAYTHGRMFGGTPQGLSREAGHPIRVGFRVCNAHDRAFRPKPFQEAVLEQTKRRKYIQTPMGWRRWFWNWKPKPTEVLGSIIQATAADLCKVVLRECLSSSEVASGEITILTTTHDSIVVMSPDPERAAAWLKAKMEMPIPWLEGRKWRADIKIGKNWREVS
jgi:DNA polymerase I-like protein with 3'-5' exonuclease and polymerase domains